MLIFIENSRFFTGFFIAKIFRRINIGILTSSNTPYYTEFSYVCYIVKQETSFRLNL